MRLVAIMTSCVALLVIATGPRVAQAGSEDDASGTIADLDNRDVTLDEALPVPVEPARAAAAYRRFLGLQGGDPRLRAEAMRRLADLELERDEAARAGDSGSGDPRALAEAIRLYEALLHEFPDHSRSDAVRYQLSRAYDNAGEPGRSLAMLDELVQRHPDSVRYAEAQFRRGEIHFSAGRYAQAEQAYAAVLVRDEDTGFRQQSFYKHGWSLFKQSRNEEAVASFLAVLDDVVAPDGVLLDRDALTRAERELADDAFRALAISYADLDGPQTLATSLTGRPTPVYVHLLYAALGDLYLEKERYQDAAAAYAAYSARYPQDGNAPLLHVRAIEAYRQGGFESLVLEGKREFVERYAFDAPFWATRRREEAPRVVDELRKNLHDLAQYHHARAQQDGLPEDYAAAARWYRRQLESFPDDPAAPATSFLLAEVLFEGGRLAEAATQYERTAYDYPPHSQSAEAGYAALVAYQKREAELEDPERQEWHRRAIDSALMFATTFPTHPEAGTVLTKAAQDLFALGDLDRTIAVAGQVLAFEPAVDAQKQRAAATILAHSLFDRERYAEAESAYLRVESFLAADDDERPAIVERLAASIYRQAEARQQTGDLRGAVDDFLRVATLAPAASVRANAEFDAATLLIQLGDWPQAVRVLEDFRRVHPEHPLGLEVTRNLAVAYLQTERPLEAAAEFDRVAADRSVADELRRAALWQAAELYEESAVPGLAAASYERYVSWFPQPLDPAMDARQRLAELAAESHDVAARDRWREEIIRADSAAGAARTERSRYLAAHATLASAEPALAAFESVRLVMPLDQALAAKRDAMERALAIYGRALDYQVADVTTASTFAMAEIYRGLGRDLMASERPPGLDADAGEEYELLLEEQAFPFEEKAIELYEANAARTADGVYDEWVERSFDALAELLPARYAKAEMGEDYVAVLE